MSETSGEIRLWMAVLTTHFVAGTAGRCTNEHLSDFEVARSRRFLLSDEGMRIAVMIGFDGDLFRESVLRIADLGWPADVVKVAKKSILVRPRPPVSQAADGLI